MPADQSLSVVTKPRRSGLSKSRIAIFEQCSKRLWLSIHRPELSQDCAPTNRSFRIGHEVGAVACLLYPDGLMIDASSGMAEAARTTVEALESPDRRPIFEATFIHENVVVRIDLLLPDVNGWHVVEVKSTTRVKPYHRTDLATQLWVMSGCGVPVIRASIRVIDTGFILQTPGDYRGLFVDSVADDAVMSMVGTRSAAVVGATDILVGDEPQIDVGAHCSDPFYCSFDAYCRRDLPAAPEWPTALLPGSAGKTLAAQLAATGLNDLMQVDRALVERPILQRIHEATLTNVAYHDSAGAIAETTAWSYPRTFLDFETIAFAVPRWVGTSPYQQLPFQFSAHIDVGNGALGHAAFLSTDGDDPREAAARALASLPATGAVIAWNASFERSCLLHLAEAVPMFAPELRTIADRLVDLLPVARRHYYHRDMRGSWSIKAVLPTLAPDMDYSRLTGAQSGEEAQDAYLLAIDGATSPERREELRRGLLDYCALDTMAMAVVLEQLCRRPPARLKSFAALCGRTIPGTT